MARKLSVKFLKVSSPSNVSLNKNGASFYLEIDEATLAGVTLKLPCDLLIVPQVIQASHRNSALSGILGQLTDEEGFLQSPNVRHRPTGSPTRGIFFVGSCHDETDDRGLDLEIETIKTSLYSLASGYFKIDNPAVIDECKCARCLTCYRSCPHGAIILKSQFQPLIIEDACLGCGICLSGCPAEAISHEIERNPIFDDNQARKTVIFACERSAALAEKGLQQVKENYYNEGNIEVIPVQCAGSLDIKTLMEPFLMGAEKVLVAACHEGNCRSMNGGGNAAARIKRVHYETGISTSSFEYYSIAANEPFKMLRIINS
jgi:heterodisulfide reductase subunit A